MNNCGITTGFDKADVPIKNSEDTEGQDFEEFEINGHYGLCLDFSPKGYISSCVIWDNGDYILELSGNLTKNELIDLAKTAKVYES